MPAAYIIKDLSSDQSFFPRNLPPPTTPTYNAMVKCDAIFVHSLVPRPILSGCPQKKFGLGTRVLILCVVTEEIMTTAARPTFEPARGGRGKGEGDLSALSKQYSSRDLPSHTKLKYR